MYHQLVSDPEVYASKEMQKLRVLYTEALGHRLNTKKKMRDIVLHWLNVRVSQYFMKWKLIRFKHTYYEKIKRKWTEHIRHRRKSTADAVRTSVFRSEKRNFMVANMMRNVSQLNSLEKRLKSENEKRVKTAQVYHIRTLLRSGNASAQRTVYQRNLKSAMHARAFSSL